MSLPLVTVADPEFAEHDWHAIFSSLGVLQYDTRIAWTVRMLGWCGMFGTVLWLMLHSLVNGGPQCGACKFDHLPRKCYKDSFLLPAPQASACGNPGQNPRRPSSSTPVKVFQWTR